MYKKAEGTTLTWIPAMIVIFFFSLIFISAIFALSSKQVIFGKKPTTIEIPQTSGANNLLEKNFEAFLNREIEFEEDRITIYELAEENNLSTGSAAKLFEEKAKEQFEISLPYPTEKWTYDSSVPLYGNNYQQTVVHPYWLEVFEKKEEIKPSFQTIGYNPGTKVRTRGIGGVDCQAFSRDSITIVRYTGEKKIVLCVNKNYYEALEGEK